MHGPPGCRPGAAEGGRAKARPPRAAPIGVGLAYDAGPKAPQGTPCPSACSTKSPWRDLKAASPAPQGPRGPGPWRGAIPIFDFPYNNFPKKAISLRKSGCGIRIFGDVWHPLPPRGGGSKKQIPKCPKIGYHPPLPADGVKRGAFDRRKNNWFT